MMTNSNIKFIELAMIDWIYIYMINDKEDFINNNFIE